MFLQFLGPAIFGLALSHGRSSQVIPSCDSQPHDHPILINTSPLYPLTSILQGDLHSAAILAQGVIALARPVASRPQQVKTMSCMDEEWGMSFEDAADAEEDCCFEGVEDPECMEPFDEDPVEFEPTAEFESGAILLPTQEEAAKTDTHPRVAVPIQAEESVTVAVLAEGQISAAPSVSPVPKRSLPPDTPSTEMTPQKFRRLGRKHRCLLTLCRRRGVRSKRPLEC